MHLEVSIIYIIHILNQIDSSIKIEEIYTVYNLESKTKTINIWIY